MKFNETAVQSVRRILCVSDLGRMFKLVSKIQGGLGELKSLLESHIHAQGDAAIKQSADAALNVRIQTFAE